MVLKAAIHALKLFFVDSSQDGDLGVKKQRVRACSCINACLLDPVTRPCEDTLYACMHEHGYVPTMLARTFTQIARAPHPCPCDLALILALLAPCGGEASHLQAPHFGPPHTHAACLLQVEPGHGASGDASADGAEDVYRQWLRRQYSSYTSAVLRLLQSPRASPNLQVVANDRALGGKDCVLLYYPPPG